MRENRTCSRPEDAVEILLADDCSSDENTDYNVVPGGIFVFLHSGHKVPASN